MQSSQLIPYFRIQLFKQKGLQVARARPWIVLLIFTESSHAPHSEGTNNDTFA